jgi:hypothetical protein
MRPTAKTIKATALNFNRPNETPPATATIPSVCAVRNRVETPDRSSVRPRTLKTITRSTMTILKILGISLFEFSKDDPTLPHYD